MKIVGCDLHTRYQQIAMLDRETGELVERRLAGRGASLDSQAKTCEVCTGFVRRIGAWCVLKDAFF